MNSREIFQSTFTEELYQVPLPVTIVVAGKWRDLSKPEIDLLTKITSSVRLSMANIRVVEMDALDLSSWMEKPKRVIGFGTKVSGVPYYEVISTPETSIVLADALGILNQDDDLKKKLWTCLKQLFSV